MPHSRNELRQVFRTLLLPISVEAEDECLALIENALTKQGLEQNEHPAWLRLRAEEWEESGQPSRNFRDVLFNTLASGHPTYGEAIAQRYFKLHSELQRQFLLNHRQASAFLSHSILMARLASDEFMSSAQIAKVLSARDRRVSFSRQAVEICVTGYGVKRPFDQDNVEFLFARDEEIEELVFADADLPTSALLINDVAKTLGFPADIYSALGVLADPHDISAFTPYLQILHFQCTLAEYFDHAVTDLYEFNPRGSAAKWLFGQYPEALVSAGNPFLNNAKSVERVSNAWARAKKKRERPGAMALVSILEGLESMGFLARQELSSLIRLWLHRVMRLAKPMSDQLPEDFSGDEIAAIIIAICEEDTETRGILEQRFVDALSSELHKSGDGWRARGLGDSVNATNVSRRKLGDCDYQHTEGREVVAYEAHGGRLTQVYVDEHRRTLERTLAYRCDEWAGFSEPSEWNIDVVFVAHEIAEGIGCRFESHGVDVEIRAITYEALAEQCEDGGHMLVGAFKDYVIGPMNKKTTPNRVRKKLLDMAEV